MRTRGQPTSCGGPPARRMASRSSGAVCAGRRAATTPTGARPRTGTWSCGAPPRKTTSCGARPRHTPSSGARPRLRTTSSGALPRPSVTPPCGARAASGAVDAMRTLSLPARLFVFAVIVLGAGLLVTFFPVRTLESPGLFLLLLALSSITSVFKVTLPLARSGSTMSVSYAVDFASLLLLGPNETMLVAAVSAWSQCTFRTKEHNPAHRTLFSMACLVVTVQAAGTVYIALGGVPGHFDPWSLAKPLVGAATAYFVINTGMVGTVIALSTRQSIVRIWNEN